VLGFSKRVETEGPEQAAVIYHRLLELKLRSTNISIDRGY
jgi:hypothetical protein